MRDMNDTVFRKVIVQLPGDNMKNHRIVLHLLIFMKSNESFSGGGYIPSGLGTYGRFHKIKEKKSP